MKSNAARSIPRAPARRSPSKSANCVDPGPGRRLHAANSRLNSARSSQCRRRTTSRSMSATCPAAPPIARQPNGAKTAATDLKSRPPEWLDIPGSMTNGDDTVREVLGLHALYTDREQVYDHRELRDG